MNVVFSPSHEFICIQRSDTEIEFTNVVKKRTFNKLIRQPKVSRIQGIHWTRGTNILVVTTQTVELYQVEEGGTGQLKLLKYFNVVSKCVLELTCCVFCIC